MRLIRGISPQDNTSLGRTNWARVHVVNNNLDGLPVQRGLSPGCLQVLQRWCVVRGGVKQSRRNRSSVLQSGDVRSDKGKQSRQDKQKVKSIKTSSHTANSQLRPPSSGPGLFGHAQHGTAHVGARGSVLGRGIVRRGRHSKRRPSRRWSTTTTPTSDCRCCSRLRHLR